MLPGCEPQKVRFWKSQEKAAKSHRPSQTRPNFQVIRSFEELLLEPELGEADGLAAAPDLLHQLERVELGIVDQVAAGARGVSDLDTASFGRR